MITRRQFGAGGGAALAAGAARPAAASPDAHASPWSRSTHSAVRLIATGQPNPVEPWLAGVEFELKPGFKTYWRDPGDAGMPPLFDWSGSDNIKEVEVLWPAPMRFEDGAGYSIGYPGPLVMPVKVVPRAAAAAVRLSLKINYAICEAMCIPAQGAASLTPPRTNEGGPHAAALAEALAKVPTRVALNGLSPSGLAILNARLIDGAKPALAVEAITPDRSASLDLFVEGPKGSFFGKPLLETPAADATRLRLLAPIEERAKDIAEWPLRLTLVSGDRAIETEARIPAPALR